MLQIVIADCKIASLLLRGVAQALILFKVIWLTHIINSAEKGNPLTPLATPLVPKSEREKEREREVLYTLRPLVVRSEHYSQGLWGL